MIGVSGFAVRAASSWVWMSARLAEPNVSVTGVSPGLITNALLGGTYRPVRFGPAASTLAGVNVSSPIAIAATMKEEQAHTLRHWWKRWGCGMADLVADFIGKVKVKSAQQQAGRDLATRHERDSGECANQ